MAERFSDQQLDLVLAGVGRHLVVPEGLVVADPSGASEPRRRSSTRSLVLVAAVVVLVLLVVGLAVAPARDAVADWFGIGSTEIRHVPKHSGTTAGLPALGAGVVPTTAADARARLGGTLPKVTDPVLGRPTLLAVPLEGGVLLAWARGKSTLWMHSSELTGIGLVKKLLTIDDTARTIPGLGDAAMLVEGQHVLETPQRRVAAGRTLLWVDGGLEYRLESELPARQMIAIARIGAELS